MNLRKIRIAGITFLLAGLLASFILLAGCSSSNANAIYAAGAYTGEGQGKGGPVFVTITFNDSSLVSVDSIVGEQESNEVGKPAIATGVFESQIIEAQSAEIDGATGATSTSEGVREATQDAIDQAKAAK